MAFLLASSLDPYFFEWPELANKIYLYKKTSLFVKNENA